jgi:pilus assembly protein CpaB
MAAAAILLFAMGQYRHSVQSATKQDTVLVATGEIPKGTTGDAIAAQRRFKSTPIIATQVSAGALSDAAFVQGKVAVSDILPGQQLTAADFSAPTGVLGQLAPDQRAMSVAIDEEHGDTDVVQAGDHVDIYGEFTVNGAPEVGLLFPDVLVLKPAGATAGSTTAGSTGASGATTGTSLVLALSTSQVPALAYAVDNGKLWLALRPANGTAPALGSTTLSAVLSLSSASSALSTSTTGKHP